MAKVRVTKNAMPEAESLVYFLFNQRDTTSLELQLMNHGLKFRLLI